MVDMKVEMVVISEVMVAIKVGSKEVNKAGVKPVDEMEEVLMVELEVEVRSVAYMEEVKLEEPKVGKLVASEASMVEESKVEVRPVV